MERRQSSKLLKKLLEPKWIITNNYRYMHKYLYLFLKFPSGLGFSDASELRGVLCPENTAPAEVPDFEPGPEPQLPRIGQASLAWSRSWFEVAARAWPGTAAGSKWRLEMPDRAWPRVAAGSEWPLEPGPKPQLARDGASKLPVLPGAEPQLP